MPHLRILLLVLAALFAVTAEAAIYKCVDAQGRVTFTDVRCKGGTRVDLAGDAPRAPQRSDARPAPRATGPADFPRVDGATQKRRDDLRRTVLEDEIASERREIASARQALAAAGKPAAGESAAAHRVRVQSLRDTLARHQRNVAAIERELGNLR